MRGALLGLVILSCYAGETPPENTGERAKAPEFRLFDVAGSRRTLREFQGKVVILNFWATWCVPCIEEMPALDRVGREYAARGAVVLGVAMDERGWPVVSKFLAQRRPGYPILMGTPEVAHKYGGLKTLPHTVFIDRQGRIVATHSAALDLKQLRRVIEAMLAEQP
ncbi:MAG TPA: TlpA disulfide reductase family protein [Bryobacteraceae bacterium]|nr:TlpA disulfide reductase family protein [Bryobacteraceae bacterium]